MLYLCIIFITNLFTMKALKIIGIALAVLIAIWLVAGLALPKNVSTDRSIEINASPELVFAIVNDLGTYEKWSPWKEADPSMSVTYSEQTVGAGATYTWAGDQKKSGSGKMTITRSDPPTEVATLLEFKGQGNATSTWKIEPADGGAKATWGISADFPFPWNAILLFMDFKGMIHKDFDRGLELLKAYAEKEAVNRKQPAYKIEETDMPYPYLVGVRKKIPMKDIPAFYSENFGAAMSALAAKGIQPAGMPVGAFFVWDEENQEAELLAGIPVSAKVDLGSRFTVLELPKGKALLANYYGPYEGSGSAHFAMDDYVKVKGLTIVYPVMEEYVTDPVSEPDTLKWLTKVIYPIK